MPAAAVIPALRAYIKVVAFKTPVVEIAWSGVQRGGRERKEKGCNKGVTLRIHQRFERKGGKEGRKERESVCALV